MRWTRTEYERLFRSSRFTVHYVQNSKKIYAHSKVSSLHLQAPDMFAFDHCKFHIHRCKESTGRVVMWKEMLIKNSFTLEASFAGTGIV